MLEEFKKFGMRGNVINVIDVAVGVIIGTAFGKIISSLVNDVLMPPIGRIMGNVDFSNLLISLNPIVLFLLFTAGSMQSLQHQSAACIR